MKNFSNWKYPSCHYAFMTQNKKHWLPQSVQMSSDITNYETLNGETRKLLEIVISFFVQADIEVSETYGCLYPLHFNKDGCPEVQMMFSAFANMEAIHVEAYSYIFESLNLVNSKYELFQEYKAGSQRVANARALKEGITEDNIKNALLFTLFGEGVSLYGMFALLLSLQFDNKFCGLANIINYSICDENFHVEQMSKFITQYMKYHELDKNMTEFERTVREGMEELKVVEYKWVDELMECIFLNDLPEKMRFTLGNMKDYINYLSEARLTKFFGGRNKYTNPLDFMECLTMYTHVDFIKSEVPEYTQMDITQNTTDNFLDKIKHGSKNI